MYERTGLNDRFDALEWLGRAEHVIDNDDAALQPS
jgi:hypothetical protein